MHLVSLAFIIMLLGCFGCGTAPQNGPPDDPRLAAKTEQTDQLFAAWNNTESPGCALGVIHNGVLVHSRGYGMANLEYRQPLTPRTVFRLASVSKQFTAACIALLVERDQLSLDDSVRRYIPELPGYAGAVTLRQMLHHTSGLPDYLGVMRRSGEFVRPLDFFDAGDAVRSLGETDHPLFEPGERYQYSNSNYFLMSLIVERVAEQSLRAFAAANLFGPLGMESSHFHDDVTQIVPHRATGYREAGAGFAINETQLEIVGDGGVFTTVEDLFVWDQNFYDNRLGRGGPELIETLQTRGVLADGKTIDYALGLRVDEFRGLRRITHSGSWVGFRTNLTRFPDQHFSVICLCNRSGIDAGELANKVAEIWLFEGGTPRR